jgi:hypothetical protein
MTRPEITGKKISAATSRKKPQPDDGDGPDDILDQLIPDPQVWKEFGVSSMTGHRWTNDPDLDFPPIVKIRDRNYRSRKALEEFKRRRIRGAA